MLVSLFRIFYISFFLYFSNSALASINIKSCGKDLNICSNNIDICEDIFSNYSDKNRDRLYKICLKKNFFQDKNISKFCKYDGDLCINYYSVIDGQFCNNIDQKRKKNLIDICIKYEKNSKKNNRKNKLSKPCKDLTSYKNCINIKRYDINHRRQLIRLKIIKELKK